MPATRRKPGSLWTRLGPGLITGAADDDPSGIATYSQVGAGFGNILWTAIVTFPLMVGNTNRQCAYRARARRRPGGEHSPPLSALAGLRGSVAPLGSQRNQYRRRHGAMGAALQLLVGGEAKRYGACSRRA